MEVHPGLGHLEGNIDGIVCSICRHSYIRRLQCPPLPSYYNFVPDLSILCRVIWADNRSREYERFLNKSTRARRNWTARHMYDTSRILLHNKLAFTTRTIPITEPFHGSSTHMGPDFSNCRDQCELRRLTGTEIRDLCAGDLMFSCRKSVLLQRPHSRRLLNGTRRCRRRESPVLVGAKSSIGTGINEHPSPPLSKEAPIKPMATDLFSVRDSPSGQFT